MKINTLTSLLLGLLLVLTACSSEPQSATTITENQFRYSICEPLNPEIIEKGDIAQEDIISTLSAFPWKEYLIEMNGAEKEEDIHYSPSLEFENKTTQQGMTISAVGDPNNFEFYIFYKTFTKAAEGEEDQKEIIYLTEQTEEQAIACLNALIKNDRKFLDTKFE